MVDASCWINTKSKICFDLISLFNGIINLRRLFNAKAIHREEQSWYDLTHNRKGS